jgi:hypothetical protein
MLSGHIIANVCLIFRIVPTKNTRLPGGDRFLIYAQKYDCIPQHNPSFAGSNRSARGPYPEYSSGSYILKLATRADKTILGDIIPLEQVRALADVAPRLGAVADQRLTKETSKTYSAEFALNQFFYKDMYYALDSQVDVW